MPFKKSPPVPKSKKLVVAVSQALKSETEEQRNLVAQFHACHPDSLHSERVIAAVIDCSVEKLQRDRWRGTGLPFVRFGRLVRYRKRDVVNAPVVSPAERSQQQAAA